MARKGARVMRILHTSDWHLGKHLEGKSRLPEQEAFLEDFITLVEERDIQLILIAGDIYDTSNPPAEAEKLFYKTLKKVTKGGKRMVVIIAGNHDHPDRLAASNPIARDDGILILSHPKTTVEPGSCGQHQVLASEEGYVELALEGEKIVLLTMAYPSEKRLGEMLFEDLTDEGEMQKSYSKRLGELFSTLQDKYFREDTINIAMSHLFVLGGEESKSERSIQLGGSYAVHVEDLPLKADYVALGHLHKPQKVKNSAGIPIYYSGSPLQYSKSEISYAKGCYYLECKPGAEPEIERINFKNYKPIEVWRFKSVAEALEKCEEDKERSIWVYMEIETQDFISTEDLRQLKKVKKDIVEIKPIRQDLLDNQEGQAYIEQNSIDELFTEFYEKEAGKSPSEDLMKVFLNLVEEEVE